MRTASQSPTKRRPSPSSMIAQRPPPPAPIVYFPPAPPAHHQDHLLGVARPPAATFDQSLYYAVVPSEHAAKSGAWSVGSYPVSQHQSTPPFSDSVPQHSLRRSELRRRPSASSSSSSVPARPSLPTPAATPVKPAPVSAVASSSKAVPSKAIATASAGEQEAGPQPKPKRKYTKKADFWIENGGPGRRGLLASKSEGGPAAVSQPAVLADQGTSDSTRSTQRPTSYSGSASKSTGGRKRSGSSAKTTAASSSRPATSAVPPNTTTDGSPAPRPAALLVAQPQSLPRTISAPALLTAEDGKVSLSSTEVLAADLAWLQPSRERLANTAPASRKPSQQRLGRSSAANDKAARERTRKRLAAFEAGNLKSDDVFGSPQKENARPPQAAGTRSAVSLSSHSRPPALVPARIAGMGRVAVAQGSLQRMTEAGARPIVERAGSTASGEPSSSISASTSASSVVAPDWLDACQPWVQSQVDRRRSQTDERREVLRTVRHYLESASDEEDEDESVAGQAGYSSDDDDLRDEWAAHSGGKTSSALLQSNRQVRLRNSQSNPSLTTAFDASDARQALIYRTQVSSALPDQHLPAFTAPHPDAIAAAAAEELGPGSIACICRDHVAEGAMVECNGCLFWFHLPCLGINEADLGDEWFCWRCAPHGDQLPPQMSDPMPAPPHTPKTASPDLDEGSDGGGESVNGDDDPGTPATVKLEPSPMFGPDHLGTPLQRFATPLLPSATGFSHFQSPSYSRSAVAHGGAHRLPPLPLILQGGSPGPSARPWQTAFTPRVPSHTRDQEEALFDLSSTPSRHLSRELPFGGTPISRIGAGGVGRGGRGGLSVGSGGPRLPSFGSFATPSQEFFSGLHASPYPSASSSSTSQLPGLDHYLSSVDSSGPLSPYQPLSHRWQHHSPSIQSPHYPASAGGRPGATPTARSHLRPGSNEPRQAKEQERFGEPLEQGLRAGFSGGR